MAQNPARLIPLFRSSFRRAIHKPEWHTVWNEFILSPYISLFVFTWYRNHISFPIQVILEFNPNETVVLVQDFILVSYKLRSNFAPDWLCFWSGAKTPRAGKALTESFDFIMWMRYQLHSGTKLISEWKWFRYHINTPSVKTNLLDKGL